MSESREASARPLHGPRAQCRPDRHTIRTSAGFTLIELMLVVAIVGVLASIAIPRATNMLLRAKRSEAYMVLEGAHTAQTAYLAEVGSYGSTFDSIGFELEGGIQVSPTQIDSNDYSYELLALPWNGSPNANFSVTATADLVPGDDVLDILMIENHIIVKD